MGWLMMNKQITMPLTEYEAMNSELEKAKRDLRLASCDHLIVRHAIGSPYSEGGALVEGYSVLKEGELESFKCYQLDRNTKSAVAEEKSKAAKLLKQKTFTQRLKYLFTRVI